MSTSRNPYTQATAADPVANAETYAKRYLARHEGGYDPDLAEFLLRVPEGMREEVYETIDRALANREVEIPAVRRTARRNVVVVVPTPAELAAEEDADGRENVSLLGALTVAAVVALPPIYALGGQLFDPLRIDARFGAYDVTYLGMVGHALVLLLFGGLLRRSRFGGAGAALANLSATYLLAALYLNAVATGHGFAIAALAVGSLLVLGNARDDSVQRVLGAAGLGLAAHLPLGLGLVAPAIFALGLAGAAAVVTVGYFYAAQHR